MNINQPSRSGSTTSLDRALLLVSLLYLSLVMGYVLLRPLVLS